MQEKTTNLPEWTNVKALAIAYHPVFTELSLRHWLFHRDKNGLAKYTRKLGSRVLINSAGFDKWIDSQK